MINVAGAPLQDSTLGYPVGSLERAILDALESSGERFNYNSVDELKFELALRRQTVNAANELYKSDMSFKTFRESTCNPEYWTRLSDGGFRLRPNVRASDAIRDIFINSSKYGTECATAMVIVYYKALLDVFGDDRFNQMFDTITLMDWFYIAGELREIGMPTRSSIYLPGDRRYFANPDVDPDTPEWQGENVIVLGPDLFYGHGVGRYNAETLIRILNQNRKPGATRSAYLMDSASRPNYKKLFRLYSSS